MSVDTELEAPITEEVKAIARVGEAWVQEIPQDLYIPPDALEVFLDAFEGPLDLLLYLIRKQNLDILDIPIAKITAQYIEYVELMKALRFELAAEYLVMAAMLAEIKSRMLLPRPEVTEDEEEDPRADLVRRLQEYERFRTAAEALGERPQLGQDVFLTHLKAPDKEYSALELRPELNFEMLVTALTDVIKRMDVKASHHIQKEPLSIRARMSEVIEYLSERTFCLFTELIQLKEGRLGVVVSFIAILELSKLSFLEIVQQDAFAPIHVRRIDNDRDERD